MSDTKTYAVEARRDGRWWYFRVPELDTSGQVRRVRELEQEARDVISLFLNVDETSFDVAVNVEIPDVARTIWSQSKEREKRARDEAAAAASLARRAVVALHDEGLTQAETAVVLGITRQRVHQIEAAAARRGDVDVADALNNPNARELGVPS